MPPIDLTGVGGWFGAQNALQDVIARTAARGAQERAQMESMMQLGLKDRAQMVSDRNQNLAEQTYADAAPSREIENRYKTALAGNAETLRPSEEAADWRRQQQAIALSILNHQQRGEETGAANAFRTSERIAGEQFTGAQNAAQRSNALRISQQNNQDTFRRPLLFQGLDGSPYLIDPQSGTGRAATDAAGQPLLGKATMGQQDAKKYYDRNKLALDAMDEYEWKLTPEDIAIITVKPMVKTALGTSVANSALSQNGKMYATALAQFMESYLRDDSGKLITPEEYANGARMYGRTLDASSPDEPISQFKKQGRHTINEGLLTTSGPYRAQTLQQQGGAGGGQTPPPGAAEPVTAEWVRDPKTGQLVRR